MARYDSVYDHLDELERILDSIKEECDIALPNCPAEAALIHQARWQVAQIRNLLETHGNHE